MPLSPELQSIVGPHVGAAAGIEAAIFGICWPPESTIAHELILTVEGGQTLGAAADGLDLSWSPAWLTAAGYRAIDAAGATIGDGPATASGPISWDPAVRLAKVDDKAPK